MTFGEKLFELRNGAGMSQEALADALGVTRQSVSKWERNETLPEIEKVIKIAMLFSVSTDELLLGSDAKPITLPHSPTSWEQFQEFAKLNWYYLGLIPALIGAIYWLQTLVGRLQIQSQINHLYELSQFDTPEISKSEFMAPFSQQLNLLWYPFIVGAVLLAAGLLIFFIGRKKAKNKSCLD